jgi:hypothetical protein
MHGIDCGQSLAVLLHGLQSQRRRGRDDSEDSSSSSSYCVSGTISLRLFDLELAFHVGCNQNDITFINEYHLLLFELQTVSPVDSDFDFAPDFGFDSDSDSSSPLHLPSHHPSPPPQPLQPKVSSVSSRVQSGNDLLPLLLLFLLGRKVLFRRMMLCILGIGDLGGVCRSRSSFRECVRRLRSAFSRCSTDVTYSHHFRI